MKIMGQRRTMVWLTISLVLAIAAGGKVFWFIFCTSGMLCCIGYLWTRNNARVTAACYMDTPTAQVGSRIKLILKVRNNGRWPIPWLQCWVELPATFGLDDHVVCYTFSMAGYEQKVVAEELVCSLRGEFDWGRLLLRTGDLFGIFTVTTQMGNTTTFKVLPKVYELGNMLQKVMVGGPWRQKGLSIMRGYGYEKTVFIGLRPYETGDPLSQIHWKASAKSQNLMVRQFSDLITVDWFLAVDLGRERHFGDGQESSMELAVSMAASLAATARRLGPRMGLVVFGKAFMEIPVSSLRNGFELIVDVLVKAEPGSGFDFGEVLRHRIPQCTVRAHTFIVTGDLTAGIMETLGGSRFGKSGCTVFLLQLESFGRSVDIFKRDQRINRLRKHGISVIMLNKEIDPGLLF